ncbi:MAG: DUF4003 domain-containing protein, partial [Acidimicrobiia bacterium]|nr:DUF4003 domain-containing protein [Acidimicrobiia bacterium]
LSTASPALAATSEDDYQALLATLANKTDSTPERIEEVYAERGYPHGYGSQPSEMLAALGEAGCQRYYAQAFALDVDQYEMVFEALAG